MALYSYSAMSDLEESEKPSPKDLFSRLVSELAAPRRLTAIERAVTEAAEAAGLSPSSLSRLKSKILDVGVHEIRLKWPNSSPRVRVYSSAEPATLSPLEVAMGMVDGGYLCYQTALFWNELSDQVPRTLYLAKERPSSSPTTPAPEKWSDIELRDNFTKLPSDHRNVAHFNRYRIVLLERAATGCAGVDIRETGVDDRRVQIRVTGLERTLLDCASVPENAGGIANVIEAFERSSDRIELNRLASTYAKLGFKYPHWQRVAFLLLHFGDKSLAHQWMSSFGAPKNKFFLAKGYNLDWKFDQDTQIYYPPGVLP